MSVLGVPMAVRFLDKIEVGHPGGCWIWRGAMHPRGYGSFRVAPRSTMGAHRVAYQLLVGPVPDGLQLDHLCRNRRCVNPRHLEPVTNRENQRRGILYRGDRCWRGHPFDEQNTMLRPNGSRQCRACHYASQRPTEGGAMTDERCVPVEKLRRTMFAVQGVLRHECPDHKLSPGNRNELLGVYVELRALIERESIPQSGGDGE